MKNSKGLGLIEAMIILAIIGILVAVIMGSINKKPTEWKTKTEGLSNVKGFEDCKMTILDIGSKDLYLVRCPNSSVSTNYTEGSGKSAVELSTNVRDF